MLGMERCPNNYSNDKYHLVLLMEFGRALKELTEKWKESYFTLIEKELIQEAACACIYSSKFTEMIIVYSGSGHLVITTS